ncbi:D-alanine--D-alanine ligase [Pirellula staleyi DSM 6068]|uniref:D-alanine--D-alanine ligase n=1 Tax=Pirellula staleyi (strain ATCC 27377 / DSM 6068 / ICPB 4128) TaxID=530564 RepID=D2QXW4_PIRSD|nr:D-alanine--D-alanine ligase [Pirellula staleyi]ADB18041.1 D-alanine--D-alanine ligase [Pirellula staleyi DSM 6068]
MRIGITYDLRSEYVALGMSLDDAAEFDRDDTIVHLEQALAELGHTSDRIGSARALMARLTAGDDWDLVLNIAEGIEGMGREAQVPAILDVYGIPYTFSDPLVMSLTLHKGLTKQVLAAAGLPTAPFAVISKLEDLEGLTLPYPLFAKPIAEGTSKGVTSLSKVTSPEALRAICEHLLREHQQSVLVETYLDGREFTTGLLGEGVSTRVLGSLEIKLRSDSDQVGYTYRNKENCEELIIYDLIRPADDPLVKEVEALSLATWKTLGCRDAGRVDIRCDSLGKPYLLEVNPLAGLHPEHSDLPMLATKIGMTYTELIGAIIACATPRVAASRQSKARRLPRKQL